MTVQTKVLASKGVFIELRKRLCPARISLDHVYVQQCNCVFDKEKGGQVNNRNIIYRLNIARVSALAPAVKRAIWVSSLFFVASFRLRFS